MEKSIILANDISEIARLNEFVEEIGNEFSLSPEVVFNLTVEEGAIAEKRGVRDVLWPGNARVTEPRP